MTIPCCPPELHARLLADPKMLIHLTTPGARNLDPDRPGWWRELRHCMACEGTLSYEGQGESRRWLYAVAEHQDETPRFWNALEEVAAHLAEEGRPPAHVARYDILLRQTGRITDGERQWLRDALERLGVR